MKVKWEVGDIVTSDIYTVGELEITELRGQYAEVRNKNGDIRLVPRKSLMPTEPTWRKVEYLI